MIIDVSVIIVNYNTLNMTKKCIESVQQYTKKNNYEIILIDNGSTDGSINLFSNYPGIVFIPNKENLGFGRANNVGAKVAKGKYLFFLNSDTVLLDDAISLFYDYSEKNFVKGVACCGCSLVDGELRPNLSCGNFPSLMQEFSSIGFYRLYKKMFTRKWSAGFVYNGTCPQVVDYLIGADWFINKEVYSKLNGFDENFFMYYEETDLAFRLKQSGYYSVVLPEKMIIHYGGASTGRAFSQKKLRLYFRSKSYYYKKNKGKLDVFLMKLFSILFYLTHPSFYKHLKEIFLTIIKS